jgi:hypothetical protein
MGYFRFWRRYKIFPGVWLNISKTGISFSFGPQGLKMTLGRYGVRMSAGLPGTGLYYTHHVPKDKVRGLFKKKTNNREIDHHSNEDLKIIRKQLNLGGPNG